MYTPLHYKEMQAYIIGAAAVTSFLAGKPSAILYSGHQ